MTDNKLLLLLLSCILFFACSRHQLKTFDYPQPVDTSDHPIKMQTKKVYSTNGVYADNEFDGARLNDFVAINDSLFRAVIEPENFPINPSPHYGFRIWSDTPRRVELELHYTKSKHRYFPKLGFDGETWEKIDSANFRYSSDSTHAFLTLNLTSDKLYVVAQELANSSQVRQWTDNQARHANAYLSTMGKSRLGRDLFYLDIYDNGYQNKDMVVILCRQHPPEVSGYLAMQTFVEEILADTPLSNDFRKKYRTLVFPLMNPDGVDLGHWRHNAGGIDMNRDWAYYRQPENRQVATFLVETAKKDKNNVILGLDFHSTRRDIFYTFDESLVAKDLPKFNDYWVAAINDALPITTPEGPAGLDRPITKTWFYLQFGASSITYEIGDHTPRDFIALKGKVSAKEMMQLLIFR